jgi:CBS domain-containing protein
MPGTPVHAEELFPYRSLRQVLAKRDPVVHAVAPGDPASVALQVLADHNIGLVVVLDAGKLVGVLSERDLVRHAGRSGALRDARVADLMSSDVATVAPDASFGDCMTLMDSRNVRHLPVVDEDRVVAVLSLRDLLREAVAHHRRVLAEVDRERLTAFHPMG